MELERLLGFVAAHCDGRKVFHPSNMLLDILTDTSLAPTTPTSLTLPFRCTRRAYLLYARRCRCSRVICGSTGFRIAWPSAQRQFIVWHIPGAIDMADFFTKPLPVHRHKFFAPFIASDIGGSRFSRRLDRKLTKSK